MKVLHGIFDRLMKNNVDLLVLFNLISTSIFSELIISGFIQYI